MQINKVYTYNKLQVIIDGINSRVNQGLNIAVMAKDSSDSALLFGSVQPSLHNADMIANHRDSTITFGETKVRFFKADWRSYCGMHFDILFIDSKVEYSEVLKAISMVRGVNNKEKSCFILYDISEFELNANTPLNTLT